MSWWLLVIIVAILPFAVSAIAAVICGRAITLRDIKETPMPTLSRHEQNLIRLGAYYAGDLTFDAVLREDAAFRTGEQIADVAVHRVEVACELGRLDSALAEFERDPEEATGR